MKLLDRQRMPIKSYKVICLDTDGIEHVVSVSAESLCDAIAQGLRVIRTSEWVSPIAGNTVITVKIKEAEIEHRVRVRDFEAWLERRTRGLRLTSDDHFIALRHRAFEGIQSTLEGDKYERLWDCQLSLAIVMEVMWRAVRTKNVIQFNLEFWIWV